MADRFLSEKGQEALSAVVSHRVRDTSAGYRAATAAFMRLKDSSAPEVVDAIRRYKILQARELAGIHLQADQITPVDKIS